MTTHLLDLPKDARFQFAADKIAAYMHAGPVDTIPELGELIHVDRVGDTIRLSIEEPSSGRLTVIALQVIQASAL